VKLDAVNQFVLRKQHLAPDFRGSDLVQIARDTGGLHATSATTPCLSLLARSPEFRQTDLDRELYQKRSLAKLRCVRKTVYVQPKEFLPVVFGATGRMVERASRRFMEGRGVSAEEYSRLSQAILELLQGREMTASAIRSALGTKAHLSSILYLMCDQGLLLRAKPQRGWKTTTHNYALFADYFPDVDLQELEERQAVRLLVRRYVASFGPVTESDAVWWTGLGKTAVREVLDSLQDELASISVAGLDRSFFLLRSDLPLLESTEAPAGPVVNLLPPLDPYLMGYRERARTIDEAVYGRVFDRSGNATSVILISGRVAGVWDFEQRDRPVVKLFLFSALPRGVLDRVFVQAQRVGRFMAGEDPQIVECTSMPPLAQRTVGGVMSPLKEC